MKKHFLMLIFIALACGAFAAGPLDHFILNLESSAVTVGTSKTLTIEAHDASTIKNDYAGSVYLSVSGGGEVIVDATGTSMTGSFSAGTWNGTVKILKAGGAVQVVASDVSDPSKTGISSAVSSIAGAYVKTKMTVPGMVFAPGSVTGHTGTPDLLTTQTDFGVTVYTCDEYYNEVVPQAATAITVQKLFSGGSIIVSPAGSHNLYPYSASSITFTVSLWPVPNETKLYTIQSRDYNNAGFECPLEINFYSLTDYYFRTLSPDFVTAGVPFGVTVLVSHFPPPSQTPDTTFVQAVEVKAINTSDSLDASPPLANAQLTPQPTPMRTPCVLGQAYFNVAYTKSGSIFVKPVPVGATPIVNASSPTCYSPFITVGSAQPQSFTFSSASDRLKRGQTTALSVRPYDIFGNPVTGTAVSVDIIGGTKNGYLGGNAAAYHADIMTNGFGEATLAYTAPSGNFANVIYASVAPIAVSQYVTILSELTDKFENWPNPFMAGKETTKINYSLAEDSSVKLRLYSSFGRLVWSKDIVAGEVADNENHGVKGGNTVIWDGKGDKGYYAGAGVYILKMTVTNSAGTYTQTRKIAVIK